MRIQAFPAIYTLGPEERMRSSETASGRALSLKEADVRPMGRATQGVRIINLDDKGRVGSIAKAKKS